MNNYYRNKKILITGHTGFMGSWLSIWLLSLGAKIYGIALQPKTNPNLYKASGLKSRFEEQWFCDIREYRKIKHILNCVQPEIVFHLAAQPLVELGYKNPIETMEINIIGSAHVLQAIRETASVRSLLYVTSDKCYENSGTRQRYTESDRLGGKDPYSASKAAAEIVLAAYVNSYFIDRNNMGYAAIRAGNIVGGGDWADGRIITDVVQSLKRGIPILVKNPEFVRPWQHVVGALSGYLLLGARLQQDPKRYSGAWNFGPADKKHYSVKDVVESMIESWGGGKWQPLRSVKKIKESVFLSLSSKKAEKHLGWKNRWDFKTSMNKTAQWYKNYYKGVNPYQLCLNDIEAYEQS